VPPERLLQHTTSTRAKRVASTAAATPAMVAILLPDLAGEPDMPRTAGEQTDGGKPRS
jgi:hypothetical protein